MTAYDDWLTTDPADLRDDRDDDRDDRDDRDDVPEYLDETPLPAEAPTTERCDGCAGTGWAGGVLLSRICDWGCAGAGTRLVWR
jgi:hypothetical protein